MFFEHLPKPLMRENGISTGGDRHHIMVEPLQREAMEIDKIAAKLEFADLLMSARHGRRPGHPAVEQQEAFVKIVAVAHDRRVGRSLPNFQYRTTDRSFLFRADVVANAQLLEMRLDHRVTARAGMLLITQLPESRVGMSPASSGAAVCSAKTAFNQAIHVRIRDATSKPHRSGEVLTRRSILRTTDLC